MPGPVQVDRQGRGARLRKYKVEEGESINEKAFVDLVKQALKLNETGAKSVDAEVREKDLDFRPRSGTCLRRTRRHGSTGRTLSATCHKKEYVEWVTDAKQDETRKRRIAQALEMIREGLARKTNMSLEVI
jgi:hypothetical protein